MKASRSLEPDTLLGERLPKEAARRPRNSRPACSVPGGGQELGAATGPEPDDHAGVGTDHTDETPEHDVEGRLRLVRNPPGSRFRDGARDVHPCLHTTVAYPKPLPLAAVRPRSPSCLTWERPRGSPMATPKFSRSPYPHFGYCANPFAAGLSPGSLGTPPGSPRSKETCREEPEIRSLPPRREREGRREGTRRPASTATTRRSAAARPSRRAARGRSGRP